MARWLFIFSTLSVSGCSCAMSHSLDDVGGPLDAGRDAPAHDSGPPPPRLTTEDCEAAHAGGAVACAPEGALAYCGLERCDQLSATCVGGVLVPDAPMRTTTLVEPSCALSAPNAVLDVSVGTSRYTLTHAYVDHGVGFATYLDMTFTTDGAASVCTARRLSINFVNADGTSSGGAYDGEHEVRVQLTDETLEPPYRFATGTLVITSSLPFRNGGPVTGTLQVTDGDFTVTGSFTDAAECMPWRTSGS